MPRYKNQEPLAEPLPPDDIEREAKVQEQHFINRKLLRQQLEDEVAATKLKEASLPQLVPTVEDHTSSEHQHVERLARVTGIINFRQPVQFADDDTEQPEQTFFGIPRLKRSPSTTITKPYEPKSFGQNTIRT